MVETIAFAAIYRGNHQTPGLLGWCRISSIHSQGCVPGFSGESLLKGPHRPTRTESRQTSPSGSLFGGDEPPLGFSVYPAGSQVEP